jgi:hypothetical protein
VKVLHALVVTVSPVATAFFWAEWPEDRWGVLWYGCGSLSPLLSGSLM